MTKKLATHSDTFSQILYMSQAKSFYYLQLLLFVHIDVQVCTFLTKYNIIILFFVLIKYPKIIVVTLV